MENFLKRYSKVPNGFINDFFSISKESYNDKEFAIDFDIVVKWLKIRKDSLKRTLIKYFEKNYDYKIINIKKKNKNRGANYFELILLTPDCFKELCMISQTKKAKEVRKYYLTLEKLIRQYNQEIQDKLNNKIGLLKTNQKPKINTKGGVIYILRALNTDETLYKLGKSSNLRKRLDNYNSGNANDIEPLFILETSDIDKIERCVKNIVKDFKYRKYKEVYQIDLNVLKMAVVQCDELMSNFEDYVKSNKKSTINKQFKKLRETKEGLFIFLSE